MTYAPHDVVLLAFPFSERRGQKQRPGLVVSSERFNREHRHVTVAMITTASNTRWASDLAIRGYVAAGLKVPCVLRGKFVTIADEVLIGRIGRLADADRAAVKDWLHALLI